jgi:hypothetical protein
MVFGNGFFCETIDDLLFKPLEGLPVIGPIVEAAGERSLYTKTYYIPNEVRGLKSGTAKWTHNNSHDGDCGALLRDNWRGEVHH